MRIAPLLGVVSILVGPGLPADVFAQSSTSGDAGLAIQEPRATSLSPLPIGKMPLALADAIAIGVANNLDVEVERYAPLIAEQEAEATWGAFDPESFAEVGYLSDIQPNSFALNGVAKNIGHTTDGRGGFRTLLPYVGATLGIEFAGDRATTNSAIQTLSPEYDTSLSITYSVPLLRGLIWNEPWTNVKVSELVYQASQENFTTNTMDAVERIQNDYWALVAAMEQRRVAVKSLETATALLDQTETQYEVGVVSKVEVVEAEAGVAARDFEVIVADNAYRNSQDQLISTVFGPKLTAGTTLEFIPTDDPQSFITYEIDVEKSVAMAFQKRPELQVADREIDRNEVLVRFAKNQRLPQFDIRGSYGTFGKDGERPAGTPNPFPPPPTFPAQNGTFGDAANNMFTDARGARFTIRGVFSVPIPNTAARRAVSINKLELRRSESRYKRLEQSIILGVRSAARNLEASQRGIKAANRRVVATQEQLRAERIRLEHGESTPFDVLLREQDLVQAESQQIAALQAYRDSVAALDRQQGTILERHNVVIADVRRLR